MLMAAAMHTITAHKARKAARITTGTVQLLLRSSTGSSADVPPSTSTGAGSP
jgi:hypothetical protein